MTVNRMNIVSAPEEESFLLLVDRVFPSTTMI